MKPKPLASLNHFTVPFAMFALPPSVKFDACGVRPQKKPQSVELCGLLERQRLPNDGLIIALHRRKVKHIFPVGRRGINGLDAGSGHQTSSSTLRHAGSTMQMKTRSPGPGFRICCFEPGGM